MREIQQTVEKLARPVAEMHQVGTVFPRLFALVPWGQHIDIVSKCNSLGVATYNNIRIKDMLPTQEQLKERMELLQRQLRETKRLLGKRKK